jgi:hypothetical protein
MVRNAGDGVRRPFPIVALGALGILGLSVGCGGTTDIDSPAQAQGSVSQTCARVSRCRQGLSQAECEATLASDRARAIESGCGALHDALLVCDELHPGVCGPDDRYEIDPGCLRAADAIEECQGGGGAPPQTCSGGGGGCATPPCQNSCFIECGDFAAECSGWPGQPMACTCTMGRQAGRQFSAVDCQAAAGNCR